MSEPKKRRVKSEPKKHRGKKAPEDLLKVGRKKIKANWDKIAKEVNMQQVIYWIGLQATAEEIAGAFRISNETLNNRLREEFGCNFLDLKKQLGNGSDGKLKLRMNQFKMSETNASMAIWLGKQYLGQTDKPASEGEFNGSLSELLSLLNRLNPNEKLAKSNDNGPKQEAT